jgi:probable rRNA maturation factor
MHPSEPTVTVEVEVEPDVDADDLDAEWPTLEELVTSLVRHELPAGSYTISVHLVGDEAMRTLNRDHRDIDRTTDVLSFPLHDPNGMRFVLPPDHAVNLGDVVVSWPRVQAQAEEFGHSPRRELAYLIAHGVLHVLGYDHEVEPDRRRMRAREEEALAELGSGYAR